MRGSIRPLRKGAMNLYWSAGETTTGQRANQYWSAREPVLVRLRTTTGRHSDHYRLLFHPLQDASASLTPTHFLPAHLRWIIPLKVYDLHHTQHLSHSLIPSVIPERYPRHRPVGIDPFAPRAVQPPPHLPTYPQAYPRGMWTRKRITPAWKCVLCRVCTGERGGIVVLLCQEVSHFN